MARAGQTIPFIKVDVFYLYVILDIFSRYVVGWILVCRESAALAKKLIEQTVERNNIEPGCLTVLRIGGRLCDRVAAMSRRILSLEKFFSVEIRGEICSYLRARVPGKIIARLAYDNTIR